MAISFECEGCGKEYTVRDELAGKTGQCKQCGHRMTIPSDHDGDGYALEAEPEPEPIREPSALPPRNTRWATRPASEAGAPPRLRGISSSSFEAPSNSKRGFFSFGDGGGVKSVFAGVFVVGMIVLRVYSKWDRAQARNARNNGQQNAMAPGENNNFNNGELAVVAPTGPIAIPNFPKPSPPREIEPGVMFQEVNLGPPRPGATAGWTGKIWIYLPSGDHDPKSLPCVMIAPAGSNLLMGNDLGESSDPEAVVHPERIPYVKAGFAVIAYEIDGAVADIKKATEAQANQAIRRFLLARAGLVNAKIAFEYASNQVPAIDPNRISAIGHSSAGTLAVLFAENEPRLKACAAFAPALDLAKRFGPNAVNQFEIMGIGDVAHRYSPMNGEKNLNCPLFLFHARDDSNVPFVDSEEFARRADANGKSITLDLVADGDHYMAMINPGISHAIAWLNEQGAGPGK